MIVSQSARLASAVRDRETDVAVARASVELARTYRLSGCTPALVARSLRVVSLANNTVRISNIRIAVEARGLNLCGCSNACTCVAPF